MHTTRLTDSYDSSILLIAYLRRCALITRKRDPSNSPVAHKFLHSIDINIQILLPSCRIPVDDRKTQFVTAGSFSFTFFFRPPFS